MDKFAIGHMTENRLISRLLKKRLVPIYREYLFMKR